MSSAGGELCVVTAYFNPCGYRSRLANFHAFAERIREGGVPLLTVECAFADQAFQLPPGPGVLQVRSDSVLWQKERLLNLAVTHLPERVNKVVCADGDIIFADPDWAKKTSGLLDRFPVVQPFSHVRQLGPERNPASDTGPLQEGFAFARRGGRRIPARGNAGHPGYAWAFRRGLLDRHGLYDAAIMGGGDLLAAYAMLGAWEHRQVRGVFSETLDDWSRRSSLGWLLRLATKPLPGVLRNGLEIRIVPPRTLVEFRRHYLQWAQAIHGEVLGQVGYVPGTVGHLWHGHPQDRRHGRRHQGLKQANYDPAADLRKNQDGCWEWTGRKPELQSWVREYFSVRDEDRA